MVPLSTTTPCHHVSRHVPNCNCLVMWGSPRGCVFDDKQSLLYDDKRYQLMPATQPSILPPDHTPFSGGTGAECDRFLRSVRKYALDQGKIRDTAWMADYASCCLAGEALIWHLGLPSEVTECWVKLQLAFKARWNALEPRDDAPPSISLETGARTGSTLSEDDEDQADGDGELFDDPHGGPNSLAPGVGSSTSIPSLRSVSGLRDVQPERRPSLDSLEDGPSGPSSRPPYVFSTLIQYAIEGSPKGMLTLAGIYEAIEKRFPFFQKQSQPNGWKNSVRHNLSLNRLFAKRPRGICDPGKGSFWVVVPGEKAGPKRTRKRKSRSKKAFAEEQSPADAALLGHSGELESHGGVADRMTDEEESEDVYGDDYEEEPLPTKKMRFAVEALANYKLSSIPGSGRSVPGRGFLPPSQDDGRAGAERQYNPYQKLLPPGQDYFSQPYHVQPQGYSKTTGRGTGSHRPISSGDISPLTPGSPGTLSDLVTARAYPEMLPQIKTAVAMGGPSKNVEDWADAIGMKATIRSDARVGYVELVGTGLSRATFLCGISDNGGLLLTGEKDRALKVRYVPSEVPHSMHVVSEASVQYNILAIARGVEDTSNELWSDEYFHFALVNAEKGQIDLKSSPKMATGQTRSAVWSVSPPSQIIKATWKGIDLMPLVSIPSNTPISGDVTELRFVVDEDVFRQRFGVSEQAYTSARLIFVPL
ncbi:hypothetical protein FRB93_007935 [Tulasnella sp. JGI-2019a]|nr:hypothetical protein FRB93_007935 [Tulasnella sp. JGI-2019a]